MYYIIILTDRYTFYLNNELRVLKRKSKKCLFTKDKLEDTLKLIKNFTYTLDYKIEIREVL